MQVSLAEQLSSDHEKLFLGVGELAKNNAMQAYLVGGAVRDIFLKTPATDFDVVIVGPTEHFLDLLSVAWGTINGSIPYGVVTFFKKYGTAKIRFTQEILPGVKLLEFASARSETYSKPGAAPDTKPGTLEQDLLRRDFSVNALALDISNGPACELVDLTGGMKDLDGKELRVLHEKSFEDDPMRLLRGAKLAVRLGFAFESGTEALFRRAVDAKLILKVKGQRRWDELRKILDEPIWYDILADLARRGLLSQLFPIELPDDASRELISKAVRRNAKEYSQAEVIIAYFLSKQPESGREALLDLFEFQVKQWKRLEALRKSISGEHESNVR